MRHTIVTITLFAVLAVSILAETSDTVQVPVVNVEADLEKHVVATTRITQEQLRLVNPIQLSDALRTVPGLFIREYGGLGGLKTISIRGGSAAQTLVMIDGIRLNSAQNGMLDLSVVPMGFIREIDVMKGGMSALYGANAMSGAINMNLDLPVDETFAASASGGSFDEWRTKAMATISSMDVSVGMSIDAYGSDGSFPYPIQADGSPTTILRSNADIRSYAGMLRCEVEDNTNIMLVARTTDRGVPGAVVQGNTTPTQARLTEDDVVVSAQSTFDKSSDITFAAGAAGRYLDQHYSDPLSTILGPGGIDARYMLRDVSAFGTMNAGEDELQHEVRADVGWTDLRGSMLEYRDTSGIVRRSAGAGYHARYNTPQRSTRIEAAVRIDAYSDVGVALSGFAGFTHIIREDFIVIANIGTGFRPPSFNELYYLNFGTSTLKPERSMTGSIGAASSIDAFGLFTINASLDLQASQITDLIVAVPLSPVLTSAQNVGKATSIGLEAAANAYVLQELNVGSSYTLQDVRDRTGRVGLDGTRIAYTPTEMIATTATWTQNIFRARIEWLYTSFRYALPGGEYSSLLSSYHLFHVLFGAVAHSSLFETEVMLRCDNMFDVEYSVVRGYPMPGRTFRITVSVRK